MKSEYKVNFAWDDEAGVWIATSDDVTGLILEHGSLDALIERVRYAIPELLALEGMPCGDVSLEYGISRRERIAVNG
jgi:hypothetical protein